MSWFRKKSVKIGMMVLLVVGLLVGLAVPSLAATPPTVPPIKPAVAAPKFWAGKVSAINGTASFDIKNGNNPAITVKIDANTKYFVVTLPPPGPAPAANGVRQPPKPPVTPGKPNVQNNQPPRPQVVPGNPQNNQQQAAEARLQQLRKFAKPGTFADLKVGAEVVVPVVPAGTAAKEVFIIKVNKPANVQGTITAVTGNSISIKKADGTVVTLKWDAKTHFNLMGLISVQVGQYAGAAYNPETLLAITIRVSATPPPSPTPPVTPAIRK